MATTRGGGRRSRGQIDPLNSGSAAARLAKELGVSVSTIKRAGRFVDAVEVIERHVDPEIKAKIARGEAPCRGLIIEAAKIITNAQAAHQAASAEAKRRGIKA